MTLFIRQVLVAAYSLIMFVVGAFLDGKLSIPIVLNTSISSIVLFKGCIKQGIDIGTLNYRNISWLAYLSGLEMPAGIIHNQTDTIVWLNSRSRLKVGTNTTKSHIDEGRLVKIRNTVNNLNDVDIENRERSFLELSYLLQFDRQVQVRDRFYKMVIGQDVFRIFECLEISDI